MNLYSIPILLAAILKFSDSCLVIRYSEPKKCSPTDPATFLFAYSNDFDYEDIQRLYSAYSQQPWYEEIDYAVAATVRFDTKTKEDVVFHDSDTFDNSKKAAYAYMNNTYENPSPRFNSSETGSDVLDMLEAAQTLTSIYFPYTHYSSTLKLSGTGRMASITVKEIVEFFILSVAVQSTVTTESFQNLTLSWYSPQLGTYGSFTRNRGQMKPGVYSSMNAFHDADFLRDVEPSTYELTLEYNYSMEDIVMIRMFSATPIDHWLSFQDV